VPVSTPLVLRSRPLSLSLPWSLSRSRLLSRPLPRPLLPLPLPPPVRVLSRPRPVLALPLLVLAAAAIPAPDPVLLPSPDPPLPVPSPWLIVRTVSVVIHDVRHTESRLGCSRRGSSQINRYTSGNAYLQRFLPLAAEQRDAEAASLQLLRLKAQPRQLWPPGSRTVAAFWRRNPNRRDMGKVGCRRSCAPAHGLTHDPTSPSREPLPLLRDALLLPQLPRSTLRPGLRATRSSAGPAASQNVLEERGPSEWSQECMLKEPPGLMV